MKNAYTAKAYSAASATSPLAADTIPRRNPTDRDVQIEILFSGSFRRLLHARVPAATAILTQDDLDIIRGVYLAKLAAVPGVV